MSDYLDPIDDWLRTDVELLSPPGGTFERVHRRAKRRKTVVAMTAAAGAAVLIAAASALPQFVSLPGTGTSPAKIGSSGKPTAHPSKRHHSPKDRVPKSSGSAKAPASDLSLLNGGNFPAPAGFAPTSITFVGDESGVVIGQTTTSCPARHTCTAIAGTLNYGRSWSWIGAPPAGAPDGDSGVSQVRFHDDDNGWAFGPALYATHDG